MPRCSDLKCPRFPFPQVRNVPFKRLLFGINRHNLIFRRRVRGFRRRVQNISLTRQNYFADVSKDFADASKIFRRRVQGFRRRVQTISPTYPRISPTRPKDFADASKLFHRRIQGFHRRRGNAADATNYPERDLRHRHSADSQPCVEEKPACDFNISLTLKTAISNIIIEKPET